jgi:hypothetical protein
MAVKKTSTSKSAKTGSSKSTTTVKPVKTKPAKKTNSKLAKIKTVPTKVSAEDFINKIPDEQKRKDSFAIIEMLEKATGEEPVMWGSSIIGFGNKRYVSPATGREVDWMVIGFSPRKANITLYMMDMSKHAKALEKLGKHKIGGGCLYINKLSDIDVKILKAMIDATLKKK